MKKALPLFLFFLLSMCLLQGQEGDYSGNVKKILLFNSYHQTLPWNLDFEEGLKRHLYNNKFDLYIEYLDTKRKNFDTLEEQHFAGNLARLYSDMDFDLIVVTDDPALHFLYNNYDSLTFLQDIPVIASGISNIDLEKKTQDRNIFIFKEPVKFNKMANEIATMFPKADHFFIIIQNGRIGDAFRDNFMKQISASNDISPKIKFTFNQFENIAELVNQVDVLSENTVILIYNFGSDENKYYYPLEEISTIIHKNSELPIFCLLDAWVTENVIGSYTIDANQQGLILGKKVNEYFSNGQPFIRGIDSTSTQLNWVFNKQILKQYDIPHRKLPADYILITDNSRTVKVLILILCVLLLSLIIIYIINRVLKSRIKVSTQHLTDEINKFEFFVSEMPIGYIALNEEQEILNWNKAAEQIFNYSLAEVKGENLINLLSLSWEESEFLKNRNGKSIHFFTDKARTKKFDEVLCEWYLTHSATTSGSPQLFVLVIDVTEKVKLRENLEMLLEKAKEMMVQNDRYMASNLHDIKNLVLPIVAYAEMMLTDDLPLEKIRKMANRLHESAQTLAETSVNLLKINRVRGNLMTMEPDYFNMYLKIQDIMVALDVSLSKKRIRFFNKVDPNLEVYADSEMINSVLINLINNAIKFTPENGEIRVNSSYINDDYVQIEVVDTGIGINENEIEQIFSQQKYFTREGTSGEKGTGVGLVLTKDLIEKNGGLFTFKNNEETGATFSFTVKTHS